MTTAETAGPRAVPRTGVAAALTSLVDRWPLHLALIVISLIWLLPTAALLISSFRPADQVLTSGWWNALGSPFDFTIQNYQDVLEGNNIGQSFINSLFVSIPATLIPIMIAAFAAFAFSWMEFPGRDWLFILVVGLLVIPLQSTLLPVLQLTTSIGLTGSFLAIWLAHTGFGLPFGIFLLRNFIGSMPREMFESAYIDGASPVTAFFRLVMPLAVPAIASMAIFQFMWVWNDLLVALIILGGTADVAPLPVSIAGLVNSLGQGWHLLTAAAFVSMLLPLVVFFSLQRYFVRGIMGGSVKG